MGLYPYVGTPLRHTLVRQVPELLFVLLNESVKNARQRFHQNARKR